MSQQIDIYASVDIEVWKNHEATIMGMFSVDGINYHDNECRTSSDDDWNLNIRINKDDLEDIEDYVTIVTSKNVEDEQ